MENINIGPSCSPEEINVCRALFKEFHNNFSWSYKEMLGINPDIVIHEINTYHGAKLVQQNIHSLHPRKFISIKMEVKIFLKAGFIYPVPLTDWVSNIVPVNKKHGTIRVCFDYHDINRD